ncbi:MAG: low specificity L-threonine aldolase [Clostridia bacterium]|nr:low specificity L-threonine aldolase [Clostridia bacterium]
MILFTCDYNEGAHPAIMKRLTETNMEQHDGYSEDAYTEEARKLIKEACNSQDVDVHILVGGTQTNMTVISAALRTHQGVISVDTGHINRHETGTIEAHGHKVLALPGTDGKISAQQVAAYCYEHFHDEAFEHIVQPKMVYVSSPTEIGSIYSKAELIDMRKVCDEYGLFLFLDGARLGYGLAAPGNDLDLPFLAEICDVFYIGGTKQGALFGEAVVIRNNELKKDFRYIIKQNGGMFAKGRLLALQFIELFNNDLYMELSRHAIKMALKIKSGFSALGFSFMIDSPTNQQFPVLPDAILEKLAQSYGFSYEKRIDASHSAVRFCTSWATKEENVDSLLADLKKML